MYRDRAGSQACTSDFALSYIPSMRCWNHALNPWAFNIATRYECEMSNASLKSMDTMHNGVFVTSVWATASRTVATASKQSFLAHHNVGSDEVLLLNIVLFCSVLSVRVFYNQCSAVSRVCNRPRSWGMESSQSRQFNPAVV